MNKRAGTAAARRTLPGVGFYVGLCAGIGAVILGTVKMAYALNAQIPLYNTVTGAPLDLSESYEEGRDTAAVREFLATGMNIYNEDPEFLPQGEVSYATACSGCHGHYAEGKLGPGLNDDYWTYPENDTDEGLFRTIFGGAKGMMGPQYAALTLDEMLLTMAWVRHLYTGPADTAYWLTPEQRKNFKPYVLKGH